MLAKVQAFNTENNNMPLKAAGAFIGAAVGAVLVAVVLSLAEGDEAFDFEAAMPIEESE